MKRSIKINGLDVELPLSRVTSVKTENEMIHLDKLRDGSWKLIYNENMIPDFTKVKSLEIVRED